MGASFDQMHDGSLTGHLRHFKVPASSGHGIHSSGCNGTPVTEGVTPILGGTHLCSPPLKHCQRTSYIRPTSTPGTSNTCSETAVQFSMCEAQ
jgi:hypothetical protein